MADVNWCDESQQLGLLAVSFCAAAAVRLLELGLTPAEVTVVEPMIRNCVRTYLDQSIDMVAKTIHESLVSLAREIVAARDERGGVELQ